jgi:hypothetical protein
MVFVFFFFYFFILFFFIFCGFWWTLGLRFDGLMEVHKK